ncbi:MAG: FlgD immunoglobulin-like domain containing protein [Candidatus Peregrinibacteria bacterium]
MFKTLKKWLTAGLITMLSAATILPQTASAENYGVKIISTNITGNLAVEYCIDNEAKMTVGIYKLDSFGDAVTVKMLEENSPRPKGCASTTWNGDAPEGNYYYGVYAYNANGSAYFANWFYLEDVDNDVKILDVEVDPDVFDPWDNQEAEITFTINKDAEVDLQIVDEDNEEVVTLIDNKDLSAGEHSIEWDGEDAWGNIVPQGEYEYKLKAYTATNTAKKTGYITVKRGYEEDTTIDPRLKRVFATKDNFDPGIREYTDIVFTLTAQADVRIDIYDKDGNKVEKLYDEDDVQPGSYKVTWDGEETIDEEGIYTYKITARNSKGEDSFEGEIEVEDDENDNRKPNVTKDTTTEISFVPGVETQEFGFKLDMEAMVTLEIRDNRDALAIVFEDETFSAGGQSWYWDGRDDYGDYLTDGVYSYKIIAENNKGKDTEEGYFEIVSSQNYNTPYYCAGFQDVDQNNRYCDAITWAKANGVVAGYADGSFQPDTTINRAEALKVILEAMNVNILNSDGGNYGFSDVNGRAWYAPYLATALSLGIVNGYSDGTFRPENTMIRVEGLKMILETAKVKYGIVIPTQNYSQPYFDTPNEPSTKWYLSYVWFAKTYDLNDNENYFYPSSNMTRGQMVDMLYRLNMAAL